MTNDVKPVALLQKIKAAPPSTDVKELEWNEQYQMQMAAITTASFGYWKEGDEISPEYDTVALRDVAKLYGRYEAARADMQELVEALQRIVNEVPAGDGCGGFFIEHCDQDGNYIGAESVNPFDVALSLHSIAQEALAKWEKK